MNEWVLLADFADFSDVFNDEPPQIQDDDSIQEIHILKQLFHDKTDELKQENINLSNKFDMKIDALMKLLEQHDVSNKEVLKVMNEKIK